jgi:diguanylate cyclase (GGDEF)-like protein
LLLFINHLSLHPYGNAQIALWNFCTDLALFISGSYLLEKWKMSTTLLHTLITKDDLTGVLNARGFRDAAHGRLALADRYAHPVAVGRIDIDRLKSLIDTKGRDELANVLRSTANTITHCVRVTDIVGRLSSDEFVVLLPETDYTGAQTMFRRIHDALDKQAVERDWPINFSISVAAYKSAPSTIDEALQYVDRIMYRLKKMGNKDILYEEQVGPVWAAYHER